MSARSIHGMKSAHVAAFVWPLMPSAPSRTHSALPSRKTPAAIREAFFFFDDYGYAPPFVPSGL